MRNVIIKLGINEEFATMPEAIQLQIQSYNAQWYRVGKSANGYYIVDALVNDTFDPTVLADFGLTWDILGLWEWDGQPDGVLIEPEPEPEVAYAANTVTDTTIDVHRPFSRYFTRNTYDMTDPENPVQTGVEVMDDYGNVIESIPGAVLDSDGGYTHVTQRAAKLVAGVGKVDPSELNADGSYTHRPQKITVTFRIKTLIPLQATKFIAYMPDTEQGQRPTAAKEILRWAGWPKRF